MLPWQGQHRLRIWRQVARHTTRRALQRTRRESTQEFAALDQFDQILVLRAGMIVEHGAHTDLLARRGYYYELYQLQSA